VASKLFISRLGDNLSYVSYNGTSTYDPDTELMSMTKTSGTVDCLVFEPTSTDLVSLAGKITVGSKKFSVDKDSSLGLGDFLIVDSVVYELVLLNNFNNRKVFFGNISNKSESSL